MNRLQSRALAPLAHGASALVLLSAVAASEALQAQQVPDNVFRPSVSAAAYAAGSGPRIGSDVHRAALRSVCE